MSTLFRNAWVEARKAFLPFHGVVGVGYGPKLRGGEVTARGAIVVLVERKLPPRDVPEGQAIPPVFQGLPTDVREPRLTLAGEEGGERSSLPEDFCLTDHRWVDPVKIRKMRLAQQRGRSRGTKEGT